MSIFSPRSRSSSKRGFTLIELLVVISIMIIITTVMLVNQARFDSSTLLRSLAYSVALSVRQAQIYGTSVSGTNTAQANCTGGASYYAGACYAKAYGIYVNWPVGGGGATSYTLFADLDGNGRYTSPTEAVKIFNLNNGYVISEFCATTVGGSPIERCAKVGAITTMSIVFRRPNPDACFSTSAGTGACVNPPTTETYAKAYLQVQHTADGARTRNVCISPTGQIAVQAPTALCP